MEHQLLLASLGLALIVAVGANLVSAVRAVRAVVQDAGPTEEKAATLRPAEIAAALLPFLGFLVTLPAHAPWAGGQGLGRGFLIGGLAAFALHLAARRTGTATAGGASLALPVVAVGLPLLMMRAALLDALFGVAIGAFATTFLMLLARRAGEATDGRRNPAALLAGLGVTLTLAAAGVLGTLRDPRTASLPRGTWAVLALAFTAGGALAVLLAEAVRGAAGGATQGTVANETTNGNGGGAVGAAVSIGAIGLCGILAALLGTKLADGREPKSVIATLLIGLILTPLIGWLFHARAVMASGRLVGGRLLRQFGDGVPFLAILVLVTAMMVGGQLLQGYGFALALLAVYVAWAASGGASTPRHDELRLLLFGTALVLYRTFLARWSDDLHGVNLSDQYALFGLVVGAAAPHLVATLTVSGRRGQADGTRPLFSSTVAGLVSLAIPGAAVLIFGPKCALALILGAAISGVFAQGTLPILLTLAMALALDQWNGHLLPYADIARLTKIKALAVVFAVVIAAVAFAAGTAKDANDADNAEGTDLTLDEGEGL